MELSLVGPHLWKYSNTTLCMPDQHICYISMRIRQYYTYAPRVKDIVYQY